MPLTPNPKALQAARISRRAVGTPYFYGGTEFGKGIDCSGLCYESYLLAGVNLGARDTYSMWAQPWGKVDPNSAIPGDLIFSYMNEGGVPGPGHVVLSLGGGKIIQAAHKGTLVSIGTLSTSGLPVCGARRPLQASGSGKYEGGAVGDAGSSTDSSGGSTSSSGGSSSFLGGLTSGFDTLTDPHTWYRVGQVLAGIVLLVFGILTVARHKIIQTAASNVEFA
jgi:cell wall-associated NlpC family hydrolase